MAMSKERPLWKGWPVRKDFDAALHFLSLIFPAANATALVKELRRASVEHHPARDLLRASGLELLPRDAVSVAKDLKRIRKDKALSPVLLIRGDVRRGRPLLVADGYHRICASRYYDEEAPIPCLVASGEQAADGK
jgi:hypothetical protein